MQGILSLPGITGYEWVPAGLALFYQNQRPIKTGKTGTQLYAEPSPVQCSLICVTWGFLNELVWTTCSFKKSGTEVQIQF